MSLDDPIVAEHRAAIDAADDAILAALNDRVAAHRALHDHKAARGYPMVDPAREDEIRERLTAANAGPLDADDVRALVACVLRVSGDAVRRLRAGEAAQDV